MVKLQDWRKRLIQFAASEAGKPFVWGETNCVALALRALDCQCGSSLHGAYRKHMASDRAALVWTRRNGVDGIAKILQGKHGILRVAENFEDDGDILLSQRGDVISAYVLVSGCYLSSTETAGVSLFRPSGVSIPGGCTVLGVR